MDAVLLVSLPVAGAVIGVCVARIGLNRPASATAPAPDSIASLVEPLHRAVEAVERQVSLTEQSRCQQHGQLGEQIRTLHHATVGLASALKAPKARGRWGELQLKRVVELAGMVDRCDFREQPSGVRDGGRLQPDMAVQLVGGRHIVVDAKTPMDAYLAAMDLSPGERRDRLMIEHTARVRAHVEELSGKQYWRQFQRSPEFVVMFLPGEDLFSAALECDPGLIEFAAQRDVVITTPTSLIALLRSAAYGWREESLASSARVIRDLGRELYERSAIVAEKWQRLGVHLDRAIGSYNESVGSMESRLLVTARRLSELELNSGHTIRDLPSIGGRSRPLRPGYGSEIEIAVNREPSRDPQPANLPVS